MPADTSLHVPITDELLLPVKMIIDALDVSHEERSSLLSAYDRAINQQVVLNQRISQIAALIVGLISASSSSVLELHAEENPGNPNGVSSSFNLAAAPRLVNGVAAILGTLNGQVIYQGLRYNVSGKTVSYITTTLPLPQAGESHRFWYVS